MTWDELQQRAVAAVLEAIQDGQRRIVLTAPTGAGKTRMAQMLIRHYQALGKRSILYTDRKLLIEQTSKVFEKLGIQHGVRAAGHHDDRQFDVQIASIQTEDSRVNKKQAWQRHDADLVLIDEAHNQCNERMKRAMDDHHADGAAIVGITATPVGMGAYFDHLVIGMYVRELREVGALVPARHYACGEPDPRALKQTGADFSENEVRNAMMVRGIEGRVIDWFRKLNPERHPSVLFGPDVAGSLFFCEEFNKAGITAAHIDGQDIVWGGKTYRSSPDARADLLEASKDGSVCVLCNRFVLREGIDAPWLRHGILATVFGSLTSYLQSGGRLLRAYPGIETVSLQDHGGHWWRHGSLNADREWLLSYTNTIHARVRAERLREQKEVEPLNCPQCGLVLLRRECVCGYRIAKRSRSVMQTNGELREVVGEIFKPRRICRLPNADKLWEKMYFRARSERWNATFAQAEAMFARENHWAWPSRLLPFMPLNELDFHRKVREVPYDQLIPKPTC